MRPKITSSTAIQVGITIAITFTTLVPTALAFPPPFDLPITEPVTPEAWLERFGKLTNADWRPAYALGQELAALPPEQGYAIVQKIWPKLGMITVRQQILKAWPNSHPHILDVLDLGMRDPSPDVQNWACSYLSNFAAQDFAEDFHAYEDWYQTTRGKSVSEVIADSVRRFAADCARSVKKDAQKRAAYLARRSSLLRGTPEAKKAALDAGLLRTLRRWAAGAAEGSPREEIQLASDALSIIDRLDLGEADLRHYVVPLLAPDHPVAVRSAAISALGGRGNHWAIDIILDQINNPDDLGNRAGRPLRRAAAGALASIGDPRVIPALIALIDADNTQDTVYGLGYFGLHPLTGVAYDESHNGTWWRDWWARNKQRYPDPVRSLEIPTFTKAQPQVAAPAIAVGPMTSGVNRAPIDPNADIADIPTQLTNIAHDPNKRYLLIGPTDKSTSPGNGRNLLIILPGGDGGPGFNPFLRRLYKNVLGPKWLVAQAVAPRWDENQFNTIVWPTKTYPYPAAKFSTEDFVGAIITDVRAKAKINPDRIMLMGWSSGGPACYATILRPNSPVTAAFIAMSVFKPDQLPKLDNAKSKSFYLLQSPDDRVTPIRFAQSAAKSLNAAGARVHFESYEGGHGWRGDIWGNIRQAIDWLDPQPPDGRR